MNDSLSRRNFISLAGATGLSAGCTTGFMQAKRLKMAVQLYVLRDIVKDKAKLPDTFAKIKALGLEGVELWNTPAFDPNEIRRLADANGLAVCGAHLGVQELDPARIRKTLEYANIVGNPNLIVAWMQPDKNEKDPVGWWKRKADFYSAAAEFAKPYGCRVGYHNHYHEFTQRFEGKTLWEIFMTRISKDVIIQLDVGSAVHVNEDPVYWYKRFPAKSPSVHFRDEWDGPARKFPGVIGEPPPGCKGVDWKALFSAINADPVTEWGVLEPVTSDTFSTIEKSLANLRMMGLIG